MTETAEAGLGSVLITGAAGLSGRHLVQDLARTFTVHALARTPAAVDLPGSCHWHVVDLARPGFTAALPARVDHVIHLAQSRRFRDFPAGAADVVAINLTATAELLDWAQAVDVRTFTYLSTGGVYATLPSPLREEQPLPAEDIDSIYPASKLSSELLVGAYRRCFAATVVLRPFFIYGPGQEESMLIPRLVRSVATGQPVTLRGEAGFRLTPTFASDMSRAIRAGLGLTGHHVINVAGPEVLSLREVCEIIGAELGQRPVFSTEDGAAADLVPDLTQMHRLLGLPTVGFHDGLRRTLPSMISGGH